MRIVQALLPAAVTRAVEVVAMFRDALRGPAHVRIVEGDRLDLVSTDPTERADVRRYRVSGIVARPGCARRLIVSPVPPPAGPSPMEAVPTVGFDPAHPSGVSVSRYDPQTGQTTYGLFQMMPPPRYDPPRLERDGTVLGERIEDYVRRRYSRAGPVEQHLTPGSPAWWEETFRKTLRSMPERITPPPEEPSSLLDDIREAKRRLDEAPPGWEQP